MPTRDHATATRRARLRREAWEESWVDEQEVQMVTNGIDDSTHQRGAANASVGNGTRGALRSLAVIVVALGIGVVAVGCTPRSTGPWDGQPWTSSHPEPCRRYAPITSDWVAAHPDSPCAQTPPVGSTPPPLSVDLGPACSIEKGGPLVCTGGASG
jgi:hypothetical protein